MTPQQMIDAALSNLGESANSPAGQYSATEGGSVTDSTAVTGLRYLNDAKGDMTRGPFLVPGVCTATTAAKFTALSALTDGAGGVLWAVRGPVRWNGAALKHIGRDYADISAGLNVAGVPAYYSVSGTNVAVYPPPATSGTLAADGYVVPADMTLSVAPAWLPTDLHSVMVYYLTWHLGLKNLEDGRLGPSADEWRGQYESEKAEQLARLSPEDRALVAAMPGGK